ncbi:hypothetical protein PCANC_07601 [Puccinia coronata f. sp. avenae]|uniref:Uncharacterized protein n=1 Tax=Puccinia coronata f. sp. avenae TaxID=200324 RepID=A0A2N5VK94_9BASI|nr:hypothetical protein PCANC_07601 [Puccinia coronata f. sp. avenae]
MSLEQCQDVAMMLGQMTSQDETASTTDDIADGMALLLACPLVLYANIFECNWQLAGSPDLTTPAELIGVHGLIGVSPDCTRGDTPRPDSTRGFRAL